MFPLVAVGVTDKERGRKRDGVARRRQNYTRLPKFEQRVQYSGTQALLEPTQWGDQTKKVLILHTQHRREV